jgi:hypothetical protein
VLKCGQWCHLSDEEGAVSASLLIAKSLPCKGVAIRDRSSIRNVAQRLFRLFGVVCPRMPI